MFFHNYYPGQVEEHERSAKQYIISELRILEDKVSVLGNNSWEIPKIEELITQFENGKISGEEALREVKKILYNKEAAIDQNSIGPNTGGH